VASAWRQTSFVDASLGCRRGQRQQDICSFGNGKTLGRGSLSTLAQHPREATKVTPGSARATRAIPVSCNIPHQPQNLGPLFAVEADEYWHEVVPAHPAKPDLRKTRYSHSSCRGYPVQDWIGYLCVRPELAELPLRLWLISSRWSRHFTWDWPPVADLPPCVAAEYIKTQQ
jgi:hypothetical protein